MNEAKIVVWKLRAFCNVVYREVTVGWLDALWEIRRDIDAMKGRLWICVSHFECPSGGSFVK